MEPKPQYADCLSLTVLAIRENLMDYFKNDIIRLVGSSNVRIVGERISYGYHYERDIASQEGAATLRIGPVPILALRHSPDTVILFTTTLERSRSMRAVKEAVEAFTQKHLPGVVVETSKEGNKDGWKGDRALIMANAPRKESDEPDFWPQLKAALEATGTYSAGIPSSYMHHEKGRTYICRYINGEWTIGQS